MADLVRSAVDALTAATPAESVDVLVTWVGGVTLLRYRLALRKRGEMTALERRAGFLVSTLAALMIMRGFTWLRPEHRWFGILMMLPATMLPIALTLFAEGLLRRHMPRWLKVFAVGASLVAAGTYVATGLFGADDFVATAVLLAAVALSMILLGIRLATRDTASLSRAENGLVRACILVTLVGIPLAATDFRFVLGWPPVRMGTIAALLFCYTLLRQSTERGYVARWARDVAILLARAIGVCLILLLALRSAPSELMLPLVVLATALVLSLAIVDRLRDASARRHENALVRWLARPPAGSLTAFMRDLRHLPLTADALLLEPGDLQPYHTESIRAALATRGGVRSLGDLRMERQGSSDAARGADELTDLLERTDMTHAALLSSNPTRLLLANIPDLPGGGDGRVALAAVVRRGQHAIANELSGDTATPASMAT